MVTNKIFQEKKTEKLLMATEDQTLGIKAYRATILNQQCSKKCRMCNKRNETIMHILSKYSKPAQTEHTKHNDKVAPMVHLELCSKYGFESDKHWYEHRMNGVIKTRIQRYYWDLDIRTDRVMEVIHPDIMLIDKKNQETFVINVAIPEDFCVRDKEAEKIL